MRAIILAAGFGSRMYPLAQDVPKCLLPIENETILGRQIRLLKECGIQDIIVVIGHLGNKIYKEFERQVVFCTNPHYAITNSLYSLWIAKNYLTSDTIIANADVVFTRASLEALVSDGHTYCLLIGKKDCNEEDHKVKVQDNLVIEVNKTMLPKEAFGEFVGLAKVQKEGLEVFKKALLSRALNHPGAFWVSTFQILMRKGRKVNYVLARGPWVEIDTKEDYEEAKKITW